VPACNQTTVPALKAVLDDIRQPFLERAVSDLRQCHETLVLEADLTGRPVSSTNYTFQVLRLATWVARSA
jgi:hypothetical protein